MCRQFALCFFRVRVERFKLSLGFRKGTRRVGSESGRVLSETGRVLSETGRVRSGTGRGGLWTGRGDKPMMDLRGCPTGSTAHIPGSGRRQRRCDQTPGRGGPPVLGCAFGGSGRRWLPVANSPLWHNV